MLFREKMQLWVREAVAELGGEAGIIETAKQIWRSHEAELKEAGDHFYTWQYDMRWAAQQLRDKKQLKVRSIGSKSIWYL